MVGKRTATMTAAAYQLIGHIIRLLPDAEIRKSVEDHFATEFNRRSASFDPYAWNRVTGGTPAPNSAHGGNMRPDKERVAFARRRERAG